MKTLCTLEETRARIESGETLLLAGDERLLRALPNGNWIGGTIPYFVAEDGGVSTAEMIFVTPVESPASIVETRLYTAEQLRSIARDAPANGFTVLIIPSGSPAHLGYAEGAPSFPDIFLKPVVGWIAGVGLSDIGKVVPLVFDGRTGAESDGRAVAMHLSLPDDNIAQVGIVNLFTPGAGDPITFPTVGFSVVDCLVNGEPRNFAEYLVEKGVDTRLPLVADYSGAMINTSFQAVDAAAGTVDLYAPVFPSIEYRIAAPIGDYAPAFSKAVDAADIQPLFACNCILNYVYGDLEGRRTGNITGPMTFGEIAYQLLNQTMVYVSITSV